MKTMKKLAAAGLVATAVGFALPMAATAQMEPPQTGFAHGPEWYSWRMEQYHSAIARMSPEDRTKLMVMQDKLMQMEMEQKTMMMKMEMEIARAKRDMEMFIFSHSAIPNVDPMHGAK